LPASVGACAKQCAKQCKGIRMKKIAYAAFASAAALALAACGGETPAPESTETVETPDDAMTGDAMASEGATEAPTEAM